MPRTKSEQHQASTWVRSIWVVVLCCLTGASCSKMPASPLLAARLLADDGRHELAASAFGELVDDDPNQPAAIMGWCRSMRALGQVEQIEQRFEGATHAGGVLALGLAAVYSNDTDKAESELASALELYEDHSLGQAVVLSVLGVIDFYYVGNEARALQRLDQALSHARDASDPVVLAEILMNTATAQVEAGKLELGAQSYTEADRIYETQGLEASQARVLSGLGNVKFHVNDFEGAERAYVKACTILQRRKDDVGLTAAALDLALLYQQRGQYEDAARSALSSAMAAERVRDAPAEATARQLHSESLCRQGLFEQARDSLRIAEQTLANAEGAYPWARASVATAWGNLALAEQDPVAALEHYDQSRLIHLELEDPKAEAVDHINIGAAASDLHRWADAAAAYNQALVLLAESDSAPGTRARAIVGLSSIEEVLGNHALAVEGLATALELVRQVDDRPFEAEILTLLGFADLASEAAESALRRFSAAAEIHDQTGQTVQEAVQFTNIAEVHRALENWDAAREFENRALGVFRKAKDLELQGLALMNIAIIDAQTGRTAAALKGFDNAERFHRAVADDTTHVENRIRAAELREQIGESEAAQRDLHIAESIERDLLLRAGGADLATGIQRTKKSASRALALLLARQGEVKASFETLEAGRARALRRRLVTRQVRSGEGLGSKWQQAQAEAAAISTRLFDESISEKSRSRLLAELRLAEAKAAEAVRSWESKSGPVAMGSPKLEAIQGRLGAREALVAFALDDPVSYAWVIRSSGLELRELPSASELREHVHRFSKVVLAGDHAEIIPLANQLGSLVLEPIREAIAQVDRVYWIPDRSLLRLPFQALRIRQGDSTVWLAETLESTLLPSAQFIAANGSAALAPSGTVVAFGNPLLPNVEIADATMGGREKWILAPLESTTHRGGLHLKIAALPKLPASGAEASKVAALYGPSRGHALIGAEATEDAFKDWMGRGVAIVHVASHALIDSAVSERSALVLAIDDNPEQDGLLTIGEISGLEISGGMVVLSACQTVGEQVVSGEGLLGLSRGFLAAGARAVVATHWPVEDRAAKAMMMVFHRELRDGQTAGHALRQARLELLMSEDTSYAAPAAWAAFVLIGDGDFSVQSS